MPAQTPKYRQDANIEDKFVRVVAIPKLSPICSAGPEERIKDSAPRGEDIWEPIFFEDDQKRRCYCEVCERLGLR